jgi:hypothetical protein
MEARQWVPAEAAARIADGASSTGARCESARPTMGIFARDFSATTMTTRFVTAIISRRVMTESVFQSGVRAMAATSMSTAPKAESQVTAGTSEIAANGIGRSRGTFVNGGTADAEGLGGAGGGGAAGAGHGEVMV